jgi:hypothetical protein
MVVTQIPATLSKPLTGKQDRRNPKSLNPKQHYDRQTGWPLTLIPATLWPQNRKMVVTLNPATLSKPMTGKQDGRSPNPCIPKQANDQQTGWRLTVIPAILISKPMAAKQEDGRNPNSCNPKQANDRQT